MREKDIETAFINWLPTSGYDWEVLGRQVRVGDGIIDVLCYAKEAGTPVVVEVKLGKAPRDVLAQLCVYTEAVDFITGVNGPDRWNVPNHIWDTALAVGCIVAEDLDEMTQRAIKLSRVRFIRYMINGNNVSFTERPFVPPYIGDNLSRPLVALIRHIKNKYAEEIQKGLCCRIDFEGGRYLPHLLKWEGEPLTDLPRS